MKDLEKVFSCGLLANVFRISRLAGVAPFTYTDNGPVVSKCLTIYGYILVTFINIAVIIGFYIDVQTDPSRSLRTSTPTSCTVWISNFTIVMMITSAGVYQGSSRFSFNMNSLKQMIKIKMFIGIKHEEISNKNNRLFIILLSTGLCLLLILDLLSCVKEVFYFDKNVITTTLYAFLYYEYILILLIELQFVMLAWELRFILKSINEDLKKKTRALQSNSKIITKHLYRSDMFGVTALNNYVLNQKNSIYLNAKTEFGSACGTSFTDRHRDGELENYSSRSIRKSAIAYGLACDVLRQINDNYGIVLLFIVLSFFLQLIITPYYMIATLYSSVDWKTNLVFQCFWCTFHMSNMILVVEPCHRTQEEIDQTQILVCLMLRLETTKKPVLAELDLFYKQLMLNRPSYSPMGMCTISRPLMVTIIGAVTTYLVIVFQFRTFDVHSKH